MTREEKKYFAKLEKASKNNPMVRVEAAADFINRLLTQAFTTPRGINGDGLCYLLSALTGVAVADISKKMSLADMLNGSFSAQMELDTEVIYFTAEVYSNDGNLSWYVKEFDTDEKIDEKEEFLVKALEVYKAEGYPELWSIIDKENPDQMTTNRYVKSVVALERIKGIFQYR